MSWISPHFFASSTSSRVNSSVASYAFSQSCDRRTTGVRNMVKPWGNLRKKKHEKKMGKIQGILGNIWENPCSLQWKVWKTLKNHGKIVKIQFVSVKIPFLFFLITASVSVGPCFSQIPLPPSKRFCRLFRSKPFLFCALRDVFWTLHPKFAGLHFPCIVRHPTMLQIIIDSSKSVAE